MATFGKTDIGTAGNTYGEANYVMGCKYTCPEAGTATSITIYVKGLGYGPANWVCAIYLDSDKSFLKGTEAKNIGIAQDDWVTFNLTSGQAVANQDYWLCWLRDTAGQCSVYDAGDANQSMLGTASTYPNWPANISALVPEAWAVSVYCTYTTGGGVTVKPGSTVANTMTQMLNSKMLFDIAGRMPKLAPRLVT